MASLIDRLRDYAYRLTILWRGKACWHWRYYGWNYSARRQAQQWRVRVLGREFSFGAVEHWLQHPQAVHIVLSGPSVQAVTDHPRLAAAPTIVVNGSYRAFESQTQRPDLYLVADVGYVRRQWDSFVAGARRARALAVDHRVLLEIARRDIRLLEELEIWVFDLLTRPYRRSAFWWTLPEGEDLVFRQHSGAFSLRAEAGFFPSCTVAYLALQVAARQQPSRIVFFGLDLGGSGRFYAEPTPEKTMLLKDLQRCIEPDFRLAAACLQQRGVDVINASPDSALADEIFPRRDPRAYLETLSD